MKTVQTYDITDASEDEIDELLGYDRDENESPSKWERKAKRYKRKGLSFAQALRRFSKHKGYDGEGFEALCKAYDIDPNSERFQVDETPHASQRELNKAAEGSNLKNYEAASRADLAAMTGYENYMHKVTDSMQNRLG